ncbi:PHB depolymerase family esterase [uncultured Chitinophaga sp.]|uniref:alpha/beta hydrolase family esterase n=1 Tax=uncultured Chitinophaga sp. TaxID=339340 RepID=UPI0025D808A4|nr:PHB depolymerase family esterase [uncultured Chitinophaga sp.]
MRLTILATASILLLNACSKSPLSTNKGPYDINASFDHQGTNRTYTIHLPKNYYTSTTLKFPVVFALHGGFGSAANMASLTGLNAKADSAGFIVVYPEGEENPSAARTWNAGNCCGANSGIKNTDDVGFISRLADTMIARYQGNSKKIYATGHSNGAMMCYRLASELSGKITAIAPNAGAFQMKTAYTPVRNVPVLHIHSLLDENAKYNGGKSKNYVLTGLDNVPVDSCLNVVASVAGCTALKQTVSTTSLYTVYKWSTCTDANFEVLLYLTNDGGHSWPGGTPSLTGLDTDPASQAFKNNDVIWAFFSKYSLP